MTRLEKAREASRTLDGREVEELAKRHEAAVTIEAVTRRRERAAGGVRQTKRGGEGPLLLGHGGVVVHVVQQSTARAACGAQQRAGVRKGIEGHRSGEILTSARSERDALAKNTSSARADQAVPCARVPPHVPRRTLLHRRWNHAAAERSRFATALLRSCSLRRRRRCLHQSTKQVSDARCSVCMRAGKELLCPRAAAAAEGRPVGVCGGGEALEQPGRGARPTQPHQTPAVAQLHAAAKRTCSSAAGGSTAARCQQHVIPIGGGGAGAQRARQLAKQPRQPDRPQKDVGIV